MALRRTRPCSRSLHISGGQLANRLPLDPDGLGPRMIVEGEKKVLTGRGTVSAAECEPVRVRYRVVIERNWDGGLTARGTLYGSPIGLPRLPCPSIAASFSGG